MAKKRVSFKTNEENEAILAILEGTSAEIGHDFFVSLVKNLSGVLNTYGAWVTEYRERERRMRAKAFYLGGNWLNDFEYPVAGTACETVVNEKRLVHIRDNLFGRYRGNAELQDFGKTGAVSYLGMPFEDTDGTVIGHLSVIDTEPIPEDREVFNIFRIFASRASAEMRRLRAEKETLEREEKLVKLFDSAMDAIIELDRDFRITRMNSAASKVFGVSGEKMAGRLFNRFLTQESSTRLVQLTESLDSSPEGQRYIWIPRGLTGVNEQGARFRAEATLSRFEMGMEHFYTLILRNVDEKILSEQRIRSLMLESEYLKEELKSLTEPAGIIGESRPIIRVLEDVKRVAGTEASVLITGETGTGKELVARAIHSSSGRADKPFVKVNCPAIAPNLIESEFFGHEEGAFTGATKKRDGRFKIADGGTIFLDEVGELPIDLQSKLLRVLQEGEFEPVGSSKTVRVDVRVISATNRDLLSEIKAGNFREDLYYRLNVFQIDVPPLRERDGDIEKIASSFLEEFTRKNGVILDLLTEEDVRRLVSYRWPGNIRELRNVMERAVITAAGGRLNLVRALPDTVSAHPETQTGTPEAIVLTDSEMKEREKANILRALEKSAWKVSGDDGAASLLGLPVSTLNSKIKSFGIKRPS